MFRAYVEQLEQRPIVNYEATSPACDSRILGGSKFIRSGFGSRAAPDLDTATSRSLEDVFRRRFPESDRLEITDHRGGPILLALDFVLPVGRDGEHDSVVHSIAYAGHGIPLASYAGVVVAELISGRDGPGKALWIRRPIPTPPEPLRRLTLRGLTRVFESMDRRVLDRNVTRRQV